MGDASDYERALKASAWRRQYPHEDFPSWADLRGADLEGVNLGVAVFTGANLDGAVLSEAGIKE